MTKETQNLTWQCLPKEVREEAKRLWELDTLPVHPNYDPDSVTEGAAYILTELFGNHNLTSDTEPEEMLMVSRSEVLDRFNTFNNPNWASNEEETYGAQLVIDALDLLFGDKCNPDKEPSVQVEPKFKIGDKVYCKNIREVLIVKRIVFESQKYELFDECGHGCGFWEWDNPNLEPHLEPEAKDNSNMEEKELNLVELLKDCKGEEFYSLMHGKVRFMTISADGFVMFDSPESISVYDNGKYDLNAEVIIYPSRTLYEKYPLNAAQAWQIWAEERTPKRWRAEKGKEYFYFDDGGEIYSATEEYSVADELRYSFLNYFKDEQTVKQALKAVRECLMKFHESVAQTK